MTRRTLLQSLAAAPLLAEERKFRISLAEWSIHKAIQKRELVNLDFPRVARQFSIDGLEFVNTLWAAPTAGYLRQLKSAMQKEGTQGVLIMCDEEGAMGHSVAAERRKAAQNHFKWVDYAAELGCHSIRANMYPEPGKQPATPAGIDVFLGYSADSFAYLCEYAKGHGLNVIIENHGGLSSNADILVRLMKMVNLSNFGVLPDFGNFPEDVDRYAAVEKMMPYAKGVSFKCYDFDPSGKETKLDLDRLMKIALDAGYHNWVGIEYEGDRMSEMEGIAAAKKFLDRLLS